MMSNQLINRVKASTTNTKLGKQIISINMPISSCNKNVPCFRECYANNGRYRFSNVQKRLNENLNAYLENPQLFKDDIINQIAKFDYIRWHASGDIVNHDYFLIMVEIAEFYPQKHFLVFTKKYEIVNKYLENQLSIPSNLEVVFSGWDENWIINNPFNFPVTLIEFKKDSIERKIELSKLHHCKGDCSDCKACWHLKSNDILVFNQH